MGLDVDGITILGIRTKREDFFTKTGTQRSCARCLRVSNDNNEKFCPNDGMKISKIAIEEPTPKFNTYAIENNSDPVGMWEELIYFGHKKGIHYINSIQTGDDDSDGQLAIGFVIGKTQSHRSGESKPIAISIDALNSKVAEVKEFAGLFGIEGEVELFTCVYLSY